MSFLFDQKIIKSVIIQECNTSFGVYIFPVVIKPPSTAGSWDTFFDDIFPKQNTLKVLNLPGCC
jgi:hypothetical protein